MIKANKKYIPLKPIQSDDNLDSYYRWCIDQFGKPFGEFKCNKKWCNMRWYQNGSYFLFQNEEDALAFKMKFC